MMEKTEVCDYQRFFLWRKGAGFVSKSIASSDRKYMELMCLLEKLGGRGSETPGFRRAGYTSILDIDDNWCPARIVVQ